jgi:hypothetical protein
VVTFPGPIPTSGVAFKYDKYGTGHDIIGATGSALPGEAEVSQSVYQGPAQGGPAVSSFTGPGTLASSGGAVTLDYATTNATQCAVSVTPSAATSVEMPFAYLYQGHNPAAPLSDVAPCPASTGTVLASLPSNPGSQALNYTFTLTAHGLAGLNGGSASKQLVVTVAGSSPSTTDPSTTTTTVPSPTTSTSAPATTTSSPAETEPVTTPITTSVAPATTALGPVISPGPAMTARATAPHVVRLTPERGSPTGGVRVLVIGSGFTKHMTVLFGSHRARGVRDLSATRLIAVCPAGTGVQYVRVHTARGTSAAVRSARFVY